MAGQKNRPGPKPKKLKIDAENWEDAVKKALQAPKQPQKGDKSSGK